MMESPRGRNVGKATEAERRHTAENADKTAPSGFIETGSIPEKSISISA